MVYGCFYNLVGLLHVCELVWQKISYLPSYASSFCYVLPHVDIMMSLGRHQLTEWGILHCLGPGCQLISTMNGIGPVSEVTLRVDVSFSTSTFNNVINNI